MLRAEVASPLDVLEIFTRINLGGVNVLGTDVYFAGVKTFWGAAGVDAEQRLDALCDVAPFLGSRLHGLRFVSRLASRGLGRGDLLPLTVDRLAGDRGALLLAAMDELTVAESAGMQRIAAFCAWYSTNSDLGYALREVTQELWDDVLAWAAASPRHDADWYELNKASIDSYLVGATIFGYRSVMGSPFHNLALLEALTAGSSGSGFPTEQIVAVAEAKTQRRGSRGRRVLALDSAEDRGRLARSHGRLLTALAQQIPYSWHPEENFDWDHIFPKAEAWRMWAPGHGRRKHHPDRRLINSTGNFWALHFAANRSLGKTVGESKFETLRRWASDPAEKFKVWPPERWSITDAEIDNFIEVDRLLNDDADSVESGMALFKQTVSLRADRLLSKALDQFPLVQRFAGDSGILGDNPADGHQDFREALGIENKDRHLRGVDTNQARTILNRRGDAFSAVIAERLETDGNLKKHWVWHPRRRPQMGSWVAFELVDGNCVELILKWTEAGGASLSVKAYANQGKPSVLSGKSSMRTGGDR